MVGDWWVVGIPFLEARNFQSSFKHHPHNYYVFCGGFNAVFVENVVATGRTI